MTPKSLNRPALVLLAVLMGCRSWLVVGHTSTQARQTAAANLFHARRLSPAASSMTASPLKSNGFRTRLTSMHGSAADNVWVVGEQAPCSTLTPPGGIAPTFQRRRI